MEWSALRFLLWHTLRNRTMQQARRLREPRYVVALLVGIGYLALLGRNNSQPQGHAPLGGELLELAVAGGLLLMVAWTWISAGKLDVLAYSTAEVMFLFQAPVTRRSLVQYKLLRAQVLIVASTLLWIVILGARRGELIAPLRALSLWCLFSTIYLHRLGAALTRTSAVEHGAAGIRRHPLVLVALILSAALIAAALLQAGNRWMELPVSLAVSARIQAALTVPLALVLLAPFRLLAHPLASTSVAEWARSFPWALGLLGLHYFWVIRSDAAYEEAAAEVSFRRARQLAARRAGTTIPSTERGRSAPLWPLTPAGNPSVAIFWKNVAMLLRRKRLRTWSLIALALACTLLVAVIGLPAAAHAAGTLLLVWSGFFFALGPQWIRNDLRSDLAHLELLRSYPLEPDAVVRMEAAASTLVLSLSQLTLLLLGALALIRVPAPGLPPVARPALALGAILLVPSLNFVGMMLQNGAALLFPGWVRVGTVRGGLETLGQSMLTALAYITALLLASVIPAVGATGVGVVVAPLLGVWSILPAALGAALLLVAEGWILSVWLGTVYERLDPPGAAVESC